VPEYDTDMYKGTRFFTTGSASDYMVALLAHLCESGINYKISANTLKVTFDDTFVDDADLGEEESK